MIPTMDSIIADLAAGRMDKDTAALFISQHMQNLVDIAGQRQYFIGEALNGILSYGGGDLSAEHVSKRAVEFADALIATLNKKG